MDGDERLALLAAVSNSDLSQCRVALDQAHGDMDLAAQILMGVTSEGMSQGTCASCGAVGVPGYHDQVDANTFYCQACWDAWEGRQSNNVDAAAQQDGREPQVLIATTEEGSMLERDLGLVEGIDWREVGARLASVTTKQRRTPLVRTAAKFARGTSAQESWREVARAAQDAVEYWASRGLENASVFLMGAAREAGGDLWQLLTIYEIQTASLLPRRQAQRDNAGQVARVSGCTGLASASTGALGQTDEVDVNIYDYGRLDSVVRLQLEGTPRAALVYDPACSLCPIGLSVGGLAVSRFTLYPRTQDEKPGGLPLAAVLWELLLSSRNLKEALDFLRSLFECDQRIPMAAGAALLLSQPGHGIVLVEWSRSSIFVSPLTREGVLVHANHCVLGSSLSDVETQSVAWILEESRQRQSEVEAFYAQELLAGRELDLKRLQEALSVRGVQNDSVLATVIVCPAEQELHVRFRLQTAGMERVEDTVACDFWQCFSCSVPGRKRRWMARESEASN